MTFEDRYGKIDRLLHRIAFRTSVAQQALADVEELLFRDKLRSVPLESPLFISALPRSGTTILLKILHATGRFATHTYQDMPFILCPMLWARFSRHFSASDSPRERAHGDGIQISGKSPEAFEEMIWKRFWPGHYRSGRIVPWTSSDQNQEFDDFLERHMRKVVTLRNDASSLERRYLSKNNTNIARLAAPPRPLRGGVILIPFRDPVQQAASMLRQHRRFLRIHEENDFIRRYMEAIGHHEFGKELRPVDFDGWLADAPSPEGLEFWIRYWTAAYRYTLDHAGTSTRFVSYARLTSDPDGALVRLAEAIDIPASILAPQTKLLHPPRTHPVDESDIPSRALDEALLLHERLEGQACV